MSLLSLGDEKTLTSLSCLNASTLSLSVTVSASFPLSPYWGNPASTFWVTLWRISCGKEIISSVNSQQGPKACWQPCDWAWKSVFWGLPTASWVNLEADSPAVDPWDDGAWRTPWPLTYERPWAHSHPTKQCLHLNSWPQNLWNSKYCFKLLNSEVICHAAIDNWYEYLLFTDIVLGPKTVKKE